MIALPRPYRDKRDVDTMKALLVEGRQAGGPTYYVHVGDLSWWLHYLNIGQPRRESIYLWEKENTRGRLIGWSLFSLSFHAFDVFVHPDYLDTEQAEHIWDWTEGQMCEIVKGRGGGKVRTMWVGEHDAGLIAFLEQQGYVRDDHHLLHMTRTLEAVPEPSLPPGYRVRHVGGEYEVTERTEVAHAAFGSRKPFEQYRQDYLAFMRSAAYNLNLDLVVVAPDGRFAAFCICWLDAENRVGLFEPMGTSPDFRRMGLGRAVLTEGLRRLKARGMTSAMVCVEHDNPAALRLYASVGFRTEHRILTFFKPL